MKKFIFALAALVILAALGYYYMMFGGARNVASEKALYEVSAATLKEEFSKNTTQANTKYLEKPVAVTGMVVAFTNQTIQLEQGVNATFNSEILGISTNQKVTIKGRIVGYDELLEEVHLDQCELVHQ
ncbi:hypothetical protein B0A58_00820 [Flavobacterium branchiophilum NBRC 15030 = ATCC 35035]|uniref:Putative nucleic acid binding protein n=1 Tax=Flavobacterium branchiophilum TaxID=55197 RepID=A0A543FZK1_9FLAO|nr:hypothetical protein [Flavobacterium branchiophilum]OXA81998.1 hypothetical protein B0A58_00820 [Flavobacterium branchiophilum NBRC 15030 = ATCC 35035]TQM39266.1 putative nucleic acid binding protein [Flavobacterium branchiophilum]GEM54100.1 hypothetical protein FB1_03210 [Flavobacterium branchiophilum NBRC 15030 = ATCC 35035]